MVNGAGGRAALEFGRTLWPSEAETAVVLPSRAADLQVCRVPDFELMVGGSLQQKHTKVHREKIK